MVLLRIRISSGSRVPHPSSSRGMVVLLRIRGIIRVIGVLLLLPITTTVLLPPTSSPLSRDTIKALLEAPI